MITVAVTGCSGYLGSKIIQNLEAADDVITPATKCCRINMKNNTTRR